MPSRSRSPEMPLRIREMCALLSSESRTEILRVVAQGGSSSTGEVAERSRTSESSALRHLTALASAGLVDRIETPGVARGGVKLAWVPSPDRLEDLTKDWLRYVRGD